jgi:8-oxo-dGTP pyrophosphatase MutT (NUDIX family)
LDRQGSKLLIVYDKAEEAHRGPDSSLRTDLPGSRLQFGENLEAALQRETPEESGLRIEITVPGHV